MPPALRDRANVLASSPLGTTENFPIPGVTAMIRSEPRTWAHDSSGGLIQGCFQAGAVYVPAGHETVIAPVASGGLSRLEITVGVLTIASLAVGTAATIATWKKK